MAHSHITENHQKDFLGFLWDLGCVHLNACSCIPYPALISFLAKLCNLFLGDRAVAPARSHFCPTVPRSPSPLTGDGCTVGRIASCTSVRPSVQLLAGNN